MLISKSDMRLLNYLSSKPEEQQSNSPFHWQTQVRDEQRHEAQVPQKVLWTDGREQREWENTCYYKTEGLESDLHFTNLWSADFVERDKDGSVQEAAEGQIQVKAPGGHQQQEELREERRQAQTKAPPVVWSNKPRIRSVSWRGNYGTCWWATAVWNEYLRSGTAYRSTEKSCDGCLFWWDGTNRSRGETPNRT